MKPHPDPEIRGRWRLALSLVLLAALTAFSLLARPLVPIDETRYVSVAWEMWVRGDFLVPFKNGEPYSHKPPLMFWMMHLGWWVFGVNDWWPRLVMPLFSAGGLVLLHRLAARLWPDRTGLGGAAALILVSASLWGLFATATMFDAMLAFWVLLGMHGVLRAAEGRRDGWVLLGLGIGFGVLTKGPVILLNLLPVAVLAPWWNASPGRPGWIRWYGGIALAVVLGAAIALAWAVPAGFAGGEAYRNAIFWGQTADRMVDSFAHQRPVWWYLPLLPVVLFPWFAWGGLWRAGARLRPSTSEPGVRFCLAWILPVFVAFSFISGKQPHYLLPMLPAFALLLARALDARAESRIGLPALLAVVSGLAMIAAGSGLIEALKGRVVYQPPVWPGALLAALAAGAWLAGRRGVPALATLPLLGAAVLILVQLFVLRAIGPVYDIQPMAQAIAQVQASGHPVSNLGKYHAQYQFAGRLETPLTELDSMALAPWLAAHPDAFVVLYAKDANALAGIPARHSQRYRGGAAALVDSRTATALLAAGKIR